MPLEQMDFPASYEALRPVVEHEYFDHRAVPQLEEYLDEQVRYMFALSISHICGECSWQNTRHTAGSSDESLKLHIWLGLALL